jgi:glycyl-tRNA synthetase
VASSFYGISKKLLIALGVPAEKQRFIEKLPWERAHYSAQTFDHEVLVERWGWVEVTATAHRTDYDLKRHTEFSSQDMYVFKEYEKPLEKEQVIIKPIMGKLGPAFKKEAQKLLNCFLRQTRKKWKLPLKKMDTLGLESTKFCQNI